MADRIVVNTGPLIALARGEVLDVIGTLPLEFVCPPEVRQELDDGAAKGYLDVRPPWLMVVALAAGPNPIAQAALDVGEAAVLQLAIEQKISRVCIDDWKGRRTAMAIGLTVTGSLGLLARAKVLGLIPAVRPIVDKMTKEGVWYDAQLVAKVLQGLGET
jgi:predicted nucleic acid-binding protein